MPRRGRRTGSAQRSAPILENLEPRILLSADLPGLDALGEDHAPDEPADLAQVLAERRDRRVPVQPDTGRQALVIVDPNVAGYRQLVDELTGREDADTRVEVLVPEVNGSGLDRLSEIRDARTEVDALHLVSHGGDGQVRLGSETLDSAFLGQDADRLRSWGDALAVGSDILIYGCKLAASDQGRAFIDELAELTGADVAASDDLTGHAGLGGDWAPAYRAGEVDTRLAVDADLSETWEVVLGADQRRVGVGETRVVTDSVTVADLTAGRLEFKPVADANGAVYDSFTFRVQDVDAVHLAIHSRHDGAFRQDVDHMLADLDRSAEDEEKRIELSAEAAAGVGISLTAGFVCWALRAGSMVASLLAAMPTWRSFDPMPVLAADEAARQAPVGGEDKNPFPGRTGRGRQS